jgi:hypothetical protein
LAIEVNVFASRRGGEGSTMAKRICDDLIFERITRLDDQQIEHFNALDMKLSYILIAQIFLAQIALSFYGFDHIATSVVCLTIIATCCVVIAGILDFLGLLLVNFEGEDAEALLANRDSFVTAYRAHDPNASELVIREGMIEGFVDATAKRINRNTLAIDSKVFWLKCAYWVTALAAALYVIAAAIYINSKPH